MKKSNVIDAAGNELVYDTCYLVYDQEPVIFLGHFTDTQKYVGIMVDLFDASEYGGEEGHTIMNYYLAPVNDAIVSSLESRNFTLHDLFLRGHLTWINHQHSKIHDKHATVMKTHAKMMDRYQIAKDSTLCQN
jgi:hypothetical protein